MKDRARSNVMAAERCAPSWCKRPRNSSRWITRRKSGPGHCRAARRNKAAAARKLCVAVWRVLQGHVIGALERIDTLHTKLHKLASERGVSAIKN